MGEQLKVMGDRLKVIGDDLKPDPVEPPIPPTPTNRILYGATYSDPTLPAVMNYKVQAVPAFGWGSTETNLDARIRQMANAEYRVLTACNGPARFRPSPPGPWNGLGDRILASQHQNYANWIAEIVKRHNPSGQKRGLTHVQLWNELKGYYNQAQNRWDYEGATDLQNKIFDAVKKVDPGVLCGGNYPAMSKDLPGTGSHKATNPAINGPWGDSDQRDYDALKYYFANGKFDFVCVDANLGCRPWKPDGTLNSPPGTNNAEVARYYTEVAKWIRTQVPNKPIWWSEIYPYVRGQAMWTTVAEQLKSVPGEHVLMWWAESPYPPPPVN